MSIFFAIINIAFNFNTETQRHGEKQNIIYFLFFSVPLCLCVKIKCDIEQGQASDVYLLTPDSCLLAIHAPSEL